MSFISGSHNRDHYTSLAIPWHLPGETNLPTGHGKILKSWSHLTARGKVHKSIHYDIINPIVPSHALHPPHIHHSSLLLSFLFAPRLNILHLSPSLLPKIQKHHRIRPAHLAPPIGIICNRMQFSSMPCSSLQFPLKSGIWKVCVKECNRSRSNTKSGRNVQSWRAVTLYIERDKKRQPPVASLENIENIDQGEDWKKEYVQFQLEWWKEFE